MHANSRGLQASKDLIVISKVARKIDFDECTLTFQYGQFNNVGYLVHEREMIS